MPLPGVQQSGGEARGVSEILLEGRALDVMRGPRQVLRAVDLKLHAGEALALVGPNAAGKSTLVRALLGLLPTRAGEVRVSGRPIGLWSRSALARRVALVAAGDEGGEGLTVVERVALGRYPHRGPFRPLTPADDLAVGRALEEVGIPELAHRLLRTLSAGERQLAALARGLAQEPRVLLLDEPAAHLDIRHQLRLFRVLDDARARGVAVLAVIHDLPHAARWADRMVVLAHGQVVADAEPDAVLASDACARAFGVEIRRHGLPGSNARAYSFEEPG